MRSYGGFLTILFLAIACTTAPFEVLPRVGIKKWEPKEDHTKPYTLFLGDEFPDANIATLKMLCSELTAKGLLFDDGISRFGGENMTYFTPTEMADWFLSWIGKEKDTNQ